MGLKILTVTSINGNLDRADSVLLNSLGMTNLRLDGANDSYFRYYLNEDDSVYDKYIVDETLTTADNVFTAAAVVAYTLSVHNDVNDSSSATTSVVINPNKIRRGIAFSTTKSYLWIQKGGKVEKILVDKALATIEDYITTGTTTAA